MSSDSLFKAGQCGKAVPNKNSSFLLRSRRQQGTSTSSTSSSVLLPNSGREEGSRPQAFWTLTLPLLLVGLCAILLVPATSATSSSSVQTPEVFTNTFHVRFTRDVSHHTAHQIAKRHGFVNLGPVSEQQNQVLQKLRLYTHSNLLMKFIQVFCCVFYFLLFAQLYRFISDIYRNS